MQIDYDLHGIVGVRLVDASPADGAVVSRQLGPIESPLVREPELVVRFVDRLPTHGRLRLLGRDESGFTDDAFYVLRSKHTTGVRVRIPFGEIGGRCELVCERGVPAVPWLIPIVNLTALARGVVPLHAAAFNYNGSGVVVTGWSKGGKTETLLAFMARGAQYVGDEWVYISGDGRRACGIPEPIRLWDWHLSELPEFRARVRLKSRLRLKVLGMLRATCSHGTSPLFAKASQLIQRQCGVDVAPERLFGASTKPATANFDQLFFVASHESPEIRVEPIDPQDAARRMSFSLAYERREFMALYRMFRFAFPNVENKWIDQAEEIERERLLRAFEDKPAYVVFHPYPVSIPALADAIEPLISAGDERRTDSASSVESPPVVPFVRERVAAL